MTVASQAAIVGGATTILTGPGSQSAVFGTIPVWGWVIAATSALVAAALFGYMLARFGNAKLIPPKMTIPCIDLEPIRYGANPILRFLKYHPTTGWHHTTVDEPTESDTIVLIEKSGFLARTKTQLFWKKKDLIKLGEKNRGWAIHCPQYLYRELAEALDSLSYEIGVKTEHAAHLQYELDDATRHSDDKATEKFQELIKGVKELQPYNVARPPGKR